MRTILSFDVDRTLVDRNRFDHLVLPNIKAALLEAAETSNVAVILNTGRDLNALQEIDLTIGRALDAFFLSGRGSRINQQISINDSAILPPDLIAIVFEKASLLKIPFLDVKTGSGVVHIPICETTLPFGFQKPRGWYANYHPTLINGDSPHVQDELNALKPIRLEIPTKSEDMQKLCMELSLLGKFYIQSLPAHIDFLAADQRGLQDWGVLQVMSPIDEHNKGTSLRDFMVKLGQNVEVVHFGDCCIDHNNDALVQEAIPGSRYVEVRWGNGNDEEVEKLIVSTIRKYL